MDEKKIWQNLKAGDKKALELIFHRYQEDLFQYAVKFCGNRQMAEDHLQNLYLKIWKRRERLGEVQSIKTYLWVALRRDLIQTLRRRKRRKEIRENEVISESFILSAEEFVIKGEQIVQQKKELKKAIEELSPRQREILFLRFYEGMTYQEIEKVMCINYQVARNYLSASLQKIREVISVDFPTLIS